MNMPKNETGYPESSLSIQSFLFIFLAMAVGMLAGVILLPMWSPNLSASLTGPEPKAYWYLARGSAFIALSLLWISMALGLAITNKMARLWPGAPTAFAIHEYVSLLGLGFAMFHAVVLLGDHYFKFSPVQLLVPFAMQSYLPFWVGLGQLGFYAWLVVAVTFYIRPAIGQKIWRLVHYASFLVYLGALIHGLASGTDTSLPWVQKYYWISGGSLLFLLIYRVLTSLSKNSTMRQSPAGQ